MAVMLTCCTQKPEPSQFLMISVPTYNDAAVNEVAEVFGPYNGGSKALGVGMIVSYLSQDPETVVKRVKDFLAMAESHSLPVLLELDGINYWQAHPELWNWWMPDKPGYDPANRMNVEWTSWSPDDAVKVGWRNWGSQHRVLPMPNLSSPAYVEVCHKMLRLVVPVVMDWWKALPDDKKHLLVALQPGVEISIGANNWYYPGGNDLLDKPADQDPQSGLEHDVLPARGVQAIGYAAVKTLGIADKGELTEWDVTRAVDNYVIGICKLLSDMGVPRDKLFVHAGGWKPGESVYWVAMNRYSCPGWSFYEYSRDPRRDHTAMMVVEKSDAPYWGAVEWLDFTANNVGDWKECYDNIFSIPRLRYVQVRHWGSIKDQEPAIEAIKEILDESAD